MRRIPWYRYPIANIGRVAKAAWRFVWNPPSWKAVAMVLIFLVIIANLIGFALQDLLGKQLQDDAVAKEAQE